MEVCREVTQGQGVDVVYDSIGLVTYEGSLSVVKPLGLLVLFGQSSGKVPPIDPIALSKQGSIYLTRPTLATYTATREELQKRAHEVFKLIEENILKVNINKVYSLDQASLAHQDLESRKTTGKLLLAP
ncbi:zinc-binding dehydrogenase [Acinetobacter calcoaceticus]|uniref:zinc-binding dehydrogenase n=1 Tax=Acinetobacter calcoaceticus TaxID=471 RepID=UPI00300B2578